MMAHTSVSQRVQLTIDLAAIRRNYQTIARHTHPLQVMPVLKANAYGLGVRPVGECLVHAGAARIGVAELNEALAITDFNVPIQIIGGILPEEIEPALRHGIILPIHEGAMANDIQRIARQLAMKATCHILVDTGMGRLGLRYEEARDEICRIVRECPNIRLEGIYSHFPFAYGDYDFSVHQVAAFLNLIRELREQGLVFNHIHMANSDAIHNIPAAMKEPFTMVRTGLNLYGCFDLEGRRTVSLEPTLRLTSRL
ncbi:MAG: alanine racemase, partial [Lentisphaerae bacterium]